MRTTSYLRCVVASGLVFAGLTLSGCAPLNMKLPSPPQRDLSLDFPMTVMAMGNQAQVLLLPDPGADLVTLTVRYDVGAIDDPVGQEGIAHLAEHLMFEMKLGNDHLGDLIERATVYNNAYTSMDRTDFVCKFERDKLTEVLHLEALRIAFRCNTLADEDFASELAVVINEIKEGGNGGKALYQQLLTSIFPRNHPYARGVGGTPATLAAITKTQACQFINDHYAPNNAVIAIAGPVTADTVKPALTDFSRLPARGVVPHQTVLRVAEAQRNVTLSASVAEPGLLLVWTLPREIEENTLVTAVGRIVAQRLNYAMRDLKGSAAAGQLGGPHSRVFAVWLTGNGASTEKLMKLARTALEKTDEFYGEFGFENAAARELTDRLSSYDDIDQRITLALDNHQRGITAPEALARELKALDALTKDFAAKTSKNSFAWDDAQVIRLEPLKKTDGRAKLTNASLTTIANIHQEPPVDQGAALVAMSPLALPPRTNRLGAIKERALPNGLTILTARNSNVPLVNISLVFGTGAALEPANMRGISQLTVDSVMMRNSYATAVVYYRAGGINYGYAENDGITFHVAGAAAYLDILLSGMERYAISGVYTSENVKEAVDIYKSGLTDDEKQIQAMTSARVAALYGKNHPYVESSLSAYFKFPKLTPDNAVNFSHKTFVPGNATLIVTGNFDEATLDAWIAYVFHRWHGTVVKTELPARQPTGAAFAVATDSSQVGLQLAYPGGNASTPIAARFLIGAMLEEASGAIRAELAASYGVHADYTFDRAGGNYTTSGLVDAGRASEALLLLRQRIAGLGDGSDLSKRSFAIARRKAALAASGDPTSSADLASVLITATRNGMTPSQAAELPAAIATLTYPDILPYLTAELVPSQEVILLAGPKAAVTNAFAAINVKPTWR